MKFFSAKYSNSENDWKPLKGSEWLSRFSDRCRWVGCAVAGARELGQHRFFHSRCGDRPTGVIRLGAWHVVSKKDGERRSCMVLQEDFWHFFDPSKKSWEDSGKEEMPWNACLVFSAVARADDLEFFRHPVVDETDRSKDSMRSRNIGYIWI